MVNRWKVATVGVATIGAATLGLVTTGAAYAAPASTAPTPSCARAGTSGFTAAVVAKQGQTIAGRRVDAAGCDVGIYVGPGVSHVTVRGVTVTGAKDAGILAQDTSNVAILDSRVEGNGFDAPAAGPLGAAPKPGELPQAFGISLFGVSHSIITGNTVTDNGRGGIGLMDNGPFDPGQVVGTPSPSSKNVPSNNDVVAHNKMSANYKGCGLVVAAQDLHGSISGLVLLGNTIKGTGISHAHGPDIGGLVVAADAPGSSISDVFVDGNRVTGSAEGGVIVNAETPGSSTTGVSVVGNTVAGNNYLDLEAPKTAGVIVFAGAGAQNRSTTIVGNRIAGQYYGVWSEGTTQPLLYWNGIRVTAGGTTVYHKS